MKAMVIGSGAREHAMAWALAKSKEMERVWCLPGNAGTAAIAENVDADPSDARAVIAAARMSGADFVFIGPEQYLAEGLADELADAGVACIGPGRYAAQLESSKAFSKAFCLRHGVPTARAREFAPGDEAEFADYIDSACCTLVVKKSGLAAGKGVLESSDKAELVAFGKAILKDDKLLVEEYLKGYEVSVFGLSDGKDWILLPPASDYKKSMDGDVGPNTGGMGSICPNPLVDGTLWDRIRREICEPTYRGLAAERMLYKGVCFFGIMVTEDGPKLLEYNARFGDPETQVVLPLIKSDFALLCDALARGKLGAYELQIERASAVGVAIVSGGYPGEYKKGLPVEVGDIGGRLLFHAQTRKGPEGETLTGGGRCFTLVATAPTLAAAREKAYDAIGAVSFEGSRYRFDIGAKYL